MPTLSDIQEWMPSEIRFSCHKIGFNNSISDIEHIWQTSWRLGFYRGGPVFMSALAGIDIALWDLKGEKTDTNPSCINVDKIQPED